MQTNELKAEIVRNNMTIEDLAKTAGIGRTTLWRRLNSPDEFTLAEIKNISKVLFLNKEKIMNIFFTDEVS